jgi:hypothetical protein
MSAAGLPPPHVAAALAMGLFAQGATATGTGNAV